MPTDPHHDPHLDADEDALAQMGYELEDVEYKKLGRSIGWFFAFVVFCGAAGLGIFIYFIGWNHFWNPPSSTAPFVKRLPAEPNPLLQTNVTAKTDIRDLRREENLLLHGSPTWVDQNKGVIRIPVERAMDLYMQRLGSGGNQETTMASGSPAVITEPKEPEGGESKPHG